MPTNNVGTQRSDGEGTASTSTAVANADVNEAFETVHVKPWLVPSLDFVSFEYMVLLNKASAIMFHRLDGFGRLDGLDRLGRIR